MSVGRTVRHALPVAAAGFALSLLLMWATRPPKLTHWIGTDANRLAGVWRLAGEGDDRGVLSIDLTHWLGREQHTRELVDVLGTRHLVASGVVERPDGSRVELHAPRPEGDDPRRVFFLQPVRRHGDSPFRYDVAGEWTYEFRDAAGDTRERLVLVPVDGIGGPRTFDLVERPRAPFLEPLEGVRGG